MKKYRCVIWDDKQKPEDLGSSKHHRELASAWNHSTFVVNFFISLLVSLSVQQKGILVSAHWHIVEQDLSVWRSRYWGSGQLEKLHFKTLQSESRGKWGSDQAKQKKLRSQNQHTFFVPGMQRIGGSELGLHPALTGWETLPISQILKVLKHNLSRRNAIFENIYLPVLKI